MELLKGKQSFLRLLVLILSFSCKSFCLQPDPNGGYNILVAVDDKIGPEVIELTSAYVENIKSIFQQFSTQLHSSTQSKFHINSVDILVPSGWAVSNAHPVQHVSGEFNYAGADVKVSKTASYPQVDGNQVCGKAGNYLELPWNLFSSPLNGEYGIPSKVMTAMWAQFRYGVFEEHGYPGDSRFPYFYKPTDNWEATGCSDVPVEGEFQADGLTCLPDAAAMDPSCRFVPTPANAAKTSLMHFHWLNSVTEFCTSETHNNFAPNRHNDLCQHKSIWEVIEGTTDFEAVTTPVTTAPPITIRVLQQAPLFYLLLDSTFTPEALPTLTQIWPKLGSIFAVSDNTTYSLPEYTIAAIGKFPNPDEASPTEVVDVVPWSVLKDNETAFLDAFDFSTGGLTKWRYTMALKEVAEKIKAKNHASGGVVLVLRNGGQLESFADVDYEEELIAMLKKERIFVNTIELHTNQNLSTLNLVNVAKETGGAYAGVELNNDVNLIVQNTLYHVVPLVETYSTDSNSNWDVIYEGQNVTANTPVSFRARNSMRTLRISFTTTSTLTSIQLGTTYNITHFERRSEWNAEGTGKPFRNVYTISLYQPQTADLPFRYGCATTENCAGYLVAYGMYTAEGYFNDKLDVKISTSAVEGVVTGKEPLAIYAKIRRGGSPVTHLTVTAEVTDRATQAKIDVRLTDDQKAADASANDGTYSGYHFATANGPVDISVRIENANTDPSSLPAPVGLLRPSQVFPVGNPIVEPIDTQTIAHDATVTISNANSFKPYPAKVKTLTLVTKAGVTTTASFATPELIGSDAAPGAYVYILKTSTSLKDLIDNFVGDTVEESAAAIGSTVTSDFSATSDQTTRYYAVKLTYKGEDSVLSNVVAFVADSPSATTTSVGSFGIVLGSVVSILFVGRSF